jgi:benzoyl-CoA reductase/2-hydroxyglutaryl-CoA dehydratase subunit BcrC/BadD/HgdB
MLERRATAPTRQAEKPFAILRRHYDDRLLAARTAHAGGRRVIGSIGPGVPMELAMATGHVSVAIAPLPGHPTPRADRYVTETFEPLMRPAFDQLIGDELSFLEAVIVVSRAERDALVYHSAKEVVRLGEGDHIPPLHLLSLLGHRDAATVEYGLGQFRLLVQRLRAISGDDATEAALKKAIRSGNRQRQLMRKLSAARRGKPALPGREALVALGAAKFMAPDDYSETLARFVSALKPDKTLAALPRLLVVSSIPLSSLHIYETLEAAGAVIVAEDDWWGSRATGPDIRVGDDALTSIFTHYHLHTPNRAIYPAAHRLGWFFAESRKPDIDGIVFYLPPSDRTLGWDYPRMKAYADRHGKPSLLIRSDVFDDTGRKETAAAAAAFVADVARPRPRKRSS